MHADANIPNTKLRAGELFCTQVTTENFFRFASCTQPVFADDRRWHADFPVPLGKSEVPVTEKMPQAQNQRVLSKRDTI